jgi:hypothetical protein
MSRRGTQFDDSVRQHSGWLLPVAIFIITGLLSALVLLYYLAPNPASFIEEHATPTSRSDLVHLSVGGVAFTIPANYLPYGSARKGGARSDVALYATLPDFQGYSEDRGPDFTENDANAPVAYLLIREEQFNLSEAERLDRIYLNAVIQPRGTDGPFGLTQYAFRDDSGYRGEDLFVGHLASGVVVMRCVRFGPQVPSPSCLRDMPLAHGVALNYRFKRGRLEDWRQIASGVDRLVASFMRRDRK